MKRVRASQRLPTLRKNRPVRLNLPASRLRPTLAWLARWQRCVVERWRASVDTAKIKADDEHLHALGAVPSPDEATRCTEGATSSDYGPYSVIDTGNSPIRFPV